MLPVVRKVQKSILIMRYHKEIWKKVLKQAFSLLAVIWGGYIIWLLAQYIFFQPHSDLVTIGQFSRFKENQVFHNEEERFFIIRDTKGLYAISDACTHRGCMLSNRNGQLECPCHDGIFQFNGQPVSGPVKRPLDHFYIYKNKQNKLVVDVWFHISMCSKFMANR